MAEFVPFRNICADINCIAFKLILCFNSATSYTRKTLSATLKTTNLNVDFHPIGATFCRKIIKV